MLLSKDKQSLLKIISFDFILLGIQVKDIRGSYDEGIWEFEYKRIDRHSKKGTWPMPSLHCKQTAVMLFIQKCQQTDVIS